MLRLPRRFAFASCLRVGVVFILFAAAPAPVPAQGTRADYERAARLGRRFNDQVFKQRVTPRWLPDGARFWYRNELPGGAGEFVFVDAEKGERRAAFDHTRLAEALARASGQGVAPDKLPCDRLDFPADRAAVRFTALGKRWECDLTSYTLAEQPPDTNAAPALRADLLVRPSARTGEETSISFLNRTGGEVRVFWVDTEGERKPYATLAAGGEHRQHTYAGHVWLATDAGGRTLAVFEATEEGGDAVIEPEGQTATPPPERRRPRRAAPRGTSPDGKWAAFLKDRNVWLRDTTTRVESALSTDGTAEAGCREEFHWSPDSRKLVALRRQEGEDRQVHLIESSPKDQLQPKLHSFSYAKPGDRIARDQPRLFDVASARETPGSDALFPNPWAISDVRWAPDSSRFAFVYNERGHQTLRVVAVDAASGAARAIVDERSRTFIDYSGKFFARHLDATGELLWMSERDGWNHLYLCDAANGAVKAQVTRGEWVVRGVERVDEEARQVWFRAGGIRPDQDPYHVHFARVNFDGSGLTLLTEGDGTHTLQWSPNRRFYLDTWSRVDAPPVTELRRASDGRRLCGLERADATALVAAGWQAPERFAAKGRDGATDIWGVIFRPTNFDPARRYPVLENIYAGPQGAFVPKSFRPVHGSQEMAELGFIVVQIDGMGTSQRSKAFHDVCFKNLKDAGFPDRVAWLRAAAAGRPWMDLSRVGIYGGSAGGQNALRGLLDHPEVYRVGVADCGCHDNRMDKIWWNEQWMGWPVDESYACSSNTGDAAKLQGKLLLVVGELDRNVDPASTLQVVNALVKADKDFELLLLPGAGHGAAETPYGKRRRADFFVRHLLGVEPRGR